MRRKKFADIETSEDRQEFLQYMLDKELEKIRKKIYKYQRRDVVWNPITIEETDFKDYSTAGQYEWDKDEEEHRIKISNRLVGNYVSCYYYKCHPKKFDKQVLINTIGHEIIHALVQEKFEHIFRKIEYKNRDASPVFLATLQFLDYTSSHDCATNYFCTKVWRDVQDLKSKKGTWNEFIDYIFFYLRKIDDIRENFNKENQPLGQSIDFRFSSRDSGLHKATAYSNSLVAYLQDMREIKRMNIGNTTFDIGSMMDSEKIKKLLNKKLNNDVKADIFVVKKNKMIADTTTKYNRFLYEKEENYNKYLELDDEIDNLMMQHEMI